MDRNKVETDKSVTAEDFNIFLPEKGEIISRKTESFKGYKPTNSTNIYKILPA